ncbi:DciA family protein [Aquabacterium sp. UBA2148]|uniref:DciA family protein n=1 Tax=Aquabacterium sp. UBA2148 TaxID=1946042 RepID=UPI00258091FA|nr:DciA family protein [Aquabacterium sp. UBA2148]
MSKRPQPPSGGRIRSVTPSLHCRPMVPDVPPVTRALDRASPLSSLMQRLRHSQACLEAVKEVLPPSLAAQLQAGPFDEEGWTLLVANPAASAKLRQSLPHLNEALSAKGLKVNAIRVKVRGR